MTLLDDTVPPPPSVPPHSAPEATSAVSSQAPPGTAPEAGAAGLGLRGALVLFTLCGATFMTGLDFSVITVALPDIGRSLGFSGTGSLQWVSTACMLPTAGLLPLFGRVGDLVGRRRLFLAGVVFFSACSLAAGLAGAPGPLIAARAAQGVGAAMIVPTAIALMTTSFPEGPRRTRALGVNGAVLSLGFVLGTLGGGIVTNGLSWRWTMFTLVFIGVLVLGTALATLPRADIRVPARLDVPGAVLAGSGLSALVYATSTGGQAGWSAPTTLGALVLAVAALGVFLRVERHHPAPLVPLGLLKRPTVKWAGLAGLITLGMCGGTTVLLSLYMQDVLGYTPLRTGAGFLAEGGAALAGGVVAARLISARGKVAVMAGGLVVQGLGTLGMALLPDRGGLALLLVTSGAMGLGHALTVVSFITTMTSGLSDEEQGVAGGLSQLPQFVGAVGTAGLAAVAAARTAALSDTATPALAALGGLHAAVLVAGGVCLAGATVAAGLLRRPVAATG